MKNLCSFSYSHDFSVVATPLFSASLCKILIFYNIDFVLYHKTEDPKIFIPDDGVLEMDHLESVLPDKERIFRQSAINSEHETGHITNAKKDKIFEYWLNGIIKLKKLVYPYVIINHDYKQYFIDYCVGGIPMRINLIIYDDKKIR